MSNVIKIDTDSAKVYEIDITKEAHINLHIGGCRETAHNFENGDVLFVHSDGGMMEGAKSFFFGSKKYGFKSFYGNGIIVHKQQSGALRSPEKTLIQIKRLVKFVNPELKNHRVKENDDKDNNESYYLDLVMDLVRAAKKNDQDYHVARLKIQHQIFMNAEAKAFFDDIFSRINI
jgi:hypothetical protein